ncbi:hypothetical protein F0562_025753 [Nyssa sinensis]|uniref:Uncharacterized protein n=1 Tax=Nyssa sinensis TaxID=561372 RepID=A0A5J5BCX4_9ASTE|nr:hypothetical protein F0562_025753 [Nyssa sinensis]
MDEVIPNELVKSLSETEGKDKSELQVAYDELSYVRKKRESLRLIKLIMMENECNSVVDEVGKLKKDFYGARYGKRDKSKLG